jgi:hypothetical protein
MNRTDHEFTAPQSKVLAGVSKRMKLFAGLMIASPLLSLFVTAFQPIQMGAGGRTLAGGMIATAIIAVFYIVIAFYTISAASSLQSIATSEGADVPNIIHAANALKRLFGIQYWLIVIALMAVVLWLIGMFTWMAIR